MENSETAPASPDWPLFWVAIVAVIAICVPLFLFPSASAEWIARIYSAVTLYLGVVYLWSGAAALLFCLWIALGPYAHVRLGGEGALPRFSTFNWVSMLFCAGVATGILYWGTIEWSFYYLAPPFGVEPRSDEAARWARTFGMFHWGPTGWALYCLPTLAIGHAYYCRGIPHFRLSAACHAVSGGAGIRGGDLVRGKYAGWAAKAVDLCFLFGVIGSAGTSLGFGTPMIAAGFGRIFGIEESYALTVAIAALCAALFSTSVYFGLEKGIRRLSTVNMTLVLLFLVFVLVAGPTRQLLSTALGDVAHLAMNFVRMHALAGPLDASHYEFARDWTIFYWAWWMAVGPFMGVFIAQISRGRTFREIVFGSLSLGSAGSAIFYLILGNYAWHLQGAGALDVVEVNRSAGSPHAIISVIATLPFASIAVPAFCLIGLVFLATTYDSAAYALASSASVSLEPGQAPARWHRLFWAFMLSLLPTALLAGDSGAGRLRSLQTASLIASVPLLVIFVLMAISLVRSLRSGGSDRSTNQ